MCFVVAAKSAPKSGCGIASHSVRHAWGLRQLIPLPNVADDLFPAILRQQNDGNTANIPSNIANQNVLIHIQKLMAGMGLVVSMQKT